VVADPEQFGKPIGSDKAQGKTTYVDHLGLDGARNYLKELLDTALLALADFDAKADALRALARFIVERAY